MSAPRLKDWPARFARFISARSAQPFVWGETDCAQTVRALLVALTGEDPAASFGLTPYRTALGARRLLDRLGGLAALPARAGCPSIPVTFAGRGDLALLPNGGRLALGFVVGARVAFAGKHGLVWRPAADCTAAWRVGAPVSGGPV